MIEEGSLLASNPTRPDPRHPVKAGRVSPPLCGLEALDRLSLAEQELVAQDEVDAHCVISPLCSKRAS
jgi:hypothetical protein